LGESGGKLRQEVLYFRFYHGADIVLDPVLVYRDVDNLGFAPANQVLELRLVATSAENLDSERDISSELQQSLDEKCFVPMLLLFRTLV